MWRVWYVICWQKGLGNGRECGGNWKVSSPPCIFLYTPSLEDFQVLEMSMRTLASYPCRGTGYCKSYRLESLLESSYMPKLLHRNASEQIPPYSQLSSSKHL